MKKLSILVLTLFIFVGLLTGCTTNKSENTEQPVGTDPQNQEEYPVHEIENIAVFGLDDKTDGRNELETDAVKIVSLDYDDQTVRVFSVPRNTLTLSNDQIVAFNKIYGKSGIEGSLAALNNLTGLDIEKYVAFDYEGLKALVDKLGGVEIELSQAEIDQKYRDLGIEGEAGTYTLTKDQIISYVRLYQIDDDNTRMDRTTKVLKAAFTKAKDLGALKLAGLIPDLLPYVKTNLNLDEMIQLVQDVSAFEKADLQLQNVNDFVTFSEETNLNGVKPTDYIELAKALNQAIYGKDYPFEATEILTKINEALK